LAAWTSKLAGVQYLALNGGPMFKFTEAISLSVDCADQAEVDRLWEKLGEGGQYSRCGWLKDRYGLSWQIVPSRLPEFIGDPDKAGRQAGHGGDGANEQTRGKVSSGPGSQRSSREENPHRTLGNHQRAAMICRLQKSRRPSGPNCTPRPDVLWPVKGTSG